MSLDPLGFTDSIPFLKDAQVIQRDKNTLSAVVHRDGPVRVSFFGVPALKRLEPPYLDIDALMTAGTDLPRALAAGKAIYGAAFNPQITLKALSYF